MSRHPHVEFALTVNGAYEEDELETVRKLVEELPEGSTIVEIGVLYGRTASLYMQASLERKLNTTLIDSFCVNGSDAPQAFAELRNKFPPVTFLQMDSKDAAGMVGKVDFIHIDGGHGPEIVSRDCEMYLPKLRSGGVAAFHDYSTRDLDGVSLVFPGVKEAVDKYTAGWEDLGVVNRLAVRRKP